MGSERGQGTVEWVGLVLLIALAMLALVAAGVRVPGALLARAVADRILCAAALADGCGDEPALIAAYGTDVGKLARQHMPTLFFEQGSRALPVDFRRCRSSECSDGSDRGLVHRTDERLPVTAFVHAIDCREGEAEQTEAEGANCSGDRAGYLYLQYWLYYADSATLRDMPVAGKKGYHPDDWESVQFRFGPNGEVDQRASSHHGYNYGGGTPNWGSDSGIGPLKTAGEAFGAHHNGWGPETRVLLVAGGSHAGTATGIPNFDRFTPGRRVHLFPLEPIAATSATRFAVSPPWLKEAWIDPETSGTN
jgi:hypothetical protein